MKLLAEKVAWVTGASRGIGQAIAIQLASAGAKIIACAQTKEALKKTSEIIYGLNMEEPYLLPYDLSVPSQIKNAFNEINTSFNKIDILVNNAGVLDDALLGMISDAQIRRTLSVNTEAIIYQMQLASRYMVKNNSGSIINISSIIGKVGNIGQCVYGASKAAVIGITKSAAKELAGKNIRVNAVAPGFIDTDLTRNLPSHIWEERLASVKMGRVGKPDDVASVVLFLASDMSCYVTGQVIGVDGGMLV